MQFTDEPRAWFIIEIIPSLSLGAGCGWICRAGFCVFGNWGYNKISLSGLFPRGISNDGFCLQPSELNAKNPCWWYSPGDGRRSTNVQIN
jgi:hypothetical protein